ncbi:MAG: SUF system Fe-S cluster assembly regulator [Alphaproteobacteria bacterium]|nr:SUF system Fe-S cluster assembly regulator [Alphaproteobacteria bacterium]
MLKISKISDYAIVILAQLAKDKEQCFSASCLAKETRLPEPTVSKILKILAKNNLVKSTRGINGGYTLVKSPGDITIEDVIVATDGPIAITACSNGAEPDCGVGQSCSVRGRWDDVNTAIKSALNAVTLNDMMKERVR